MRTMKILILDTVHGGDLLAEQLMAEHEVVCTDVYGITSQEVVDRLRSLFVEVSIWSPPPRFYDLVLMPSHCPDHFLKGVEYDYRANFSWAVGNLIKDNRPRIEVTGVKGKTSTCYLLAHVLDKSGLRVFLHTSRGRGFYSDGSHDIKEKMSIAPPYLLKTPEEDFDILIQEVSLGGSGKADIAVITNLADDYGIAKDSRKASDAKKWILTDNINIVPKEETTFWKRVSEKKVEGYGGTVETVGEPKLGEPLQINLTYSGERIRVNLAGDYLATQYLKTIECVAKICESMGSLSPAAFSKALTSFHGVPGRGEIIREGNVIKVLERNPGISALSVENTLKCISEMGGLEKAFAIVNPVTKKVCDALKPDAVGKVMEKYGVPYVLYDGNGPRPVPPEGTEVVLEFIKEAFQ